MHLIYDDGSEAPGFPFEVGNNIQSAPSVLDVDDQKVIFFGCNDNNFYAVNSDGSLRFSITADNKIYNSPAFLDHNNTFYIFFSDDGGILHAVDTEGNLLSGWPVNSGETISKSVIFSDLDNNGSAEVIVATESANILVYNLDGTMYDGFPVLADQSFFSAPMVSDMDGDGDLEIIAASGGSLQVLDIKLDGATDGYWSMFRGNTERTGYFEFTGGGSECGASLGDVSGDGTINILDLVQIANYILNIGDPAFECAADFTEDGTVNILDLVQIANFILDN